MDSSVHHATALPAAHPSNHKGWGTEDSAVKHKLHRRLEGACMHKTDGKLICVAAPIPGAEAGEGVRSEMGGSTM